MAVVALPVLLGPGVRTALAAPSPASASQAQLFGVRPVQQGHTTLPGGHFNFALGAGNHISDGMVVENFSGQAITFTLYGADIISASGGGVAPAQATAVMHEVGAWMTVPNPKRIVEAHQQVTVLFTLTVPVGESPGQHVGAIVASADVGTTRTGSVLQARTALLVVVTVPGVASPSGRLSPLRVSVPAANQFVFVTALANTGNLLLTYIGSVTVFAESGASVARLSLVPSNAYVVPGGVIPLTAAWNGMPPQSSAYTARATVTIFADGKPVSVLTSQLLQLPASSNAFLIIVTIAVGCLALLLVLALARRSQRRTIARRRIAVGR